MAAPWRTFGGITSTDVAPVPAIPTTAAHCALYNGEPQGGKTYVIQGVGFTQTTSAGAVIVQQLLLHLCPGVQPVIAGTAAKGPLPLDGFPNSGANGSRAQIYGGVTLTAGQVGQGFWHPVGMAINGTANTAVIGIGAWTNVNGIYYLAPGSILSMAVLCSAAGSAKNQLTVSWQEVQF